MRMRALLLIFCACFLSAQVSNSLTNDTIIKLVQAGVPTDVIIQTISAAQTVDFRFVGADLQTLTDSKVPDEIFKAMAARASAGPGPAFVKPETEKLFVVGANPSETMGHLGKTCPEITITLDRAKADYILVREDSGAGLARKPQKLTIFNRNDDLIFAGATSSISGGIKDACKVLRDRVRRDRK